MSLRRIWSLNLYRGQWTIVSQDRTDLVPPKWYGSEDPGELNFQNNRTKNDDEVRRIGFCYLKNGKTRSINNLGSVSTNRYVDSKRYELRDTTFHSFESQQTQLLAASRRRQLHAHKGDDNHTSTKATTKSRKKTYTNIDLY